jgi:hypothetical protein
MQPLQCPSAVNVAGQKACHGAGFKAATCSKALGTGLSGKGLCLGIGLGAGIWGPIGLVGIGIIGGYYYWKKASEMLD